LSRAQLDALTQAPDVAALGEALRRHGYPVEEGERSPAALELALRRMAAGRLHVLARWCGPRTAVLTVLFEDEDRRSMRAILRGAVQGIAADVRLAGLVPTPTLPERALRELAQQRTAGAIAALLTAWRNPYGSLLLPAASTAQPDLFTLELLLNRTFADRAGRAARGTGLLAAYVREAIDLENAYTALVLASEGKDVTPKDAFLPGGASLSIATFEIAAATGDVAEAARRLAAAFAGSVLAPAFQRVSDAAVGLEDAVLRARIRALVRAMRTEPLGPAPLLAYVLRLRAEIVDLERVLWGVALAVPPGTLARDLVTV
jgi:vacuolar-type H+-ATPase subunit C/Vma6